MNQGSGKTKAVIKFIALFAVLGLLYYFGRDIDITLSALRDYVSKYPMALGAVLFAGLYCFISVVPIAGRDVLKLLAALLWGWIPSTCFVFAGEMLAALVSFLLARILGKDLIDRLFGGRLESSYEKLNHAGFRNVMVLRLLPITPYRYFNFAAGVTDLHLGPYMLGSAVGIFGRTLFFQYFFARFGEYMVKKGMTVGQIAIFSIVFGVVMIVIWIVYSRLSKKSAPAMPGTETRP